MVTYDSYSKDLTHIGDRRRIGLWIKRFDTWTKSKEFDCQGIHIATPLSNFEKLKKGRGTTRLILDMVDGYLVEEAGVFKDYMRNLNRVGILAFFKDPKRYSDSLVEFCKACDLITVGSEEQAVIARQFNPNVFPIWDCHDEFGPPANSIFKAKTSNFNIFWEGLSVTLKHFQECLADLKSFMLQTNSTLNIVTNSEHYRFSNRYLKVDTEKYIGRIFKGLEEQVYFHPWSITKVREVSAQCDFGLIPLLAEDRFARLKPENKLMIYWRLGLPTLFSNSPAYLRVSGELGLSDFAVSEGMWEEKLYWLSENLTVEGRRISSATKMLREKHNEQAILFKWEEALQTLAR
jgi:hypothetical protein